MTIERERPAALPTLRGVLEDTLARQVVAVGLPAPVRELHPMWCCEHPKREHVAAPAFGDAEGLCGWCMAPLAHHSYEHERDWRIDLAWPAAMLAVETDGGTFAGGRHTRGAGYEADCEKCNELTIRGWRVLRVTTAMVDDGRALDYIERALR